MTASEEKKNLIYGACVIFLISSEHLSPSLARCNLLNDRPDECHFSVTPIVYWERHVLSRSQKYAAPWRTISLWCVPRRSSKTSIWPLIPMQEHWWISMSFEMEPMSFGQSNPLNFSRVWHCRSLSLSDRFDRISCWFDSISVMWASIGRTSSLECNTGPCRASTRWKLCTIFEISHGLYVIETSLNGDETRWFDLVRRTAEHPTTSRCRPVSLDPSSLLSQSSRNGYLSSISSSRKSLFNL